MINLSIIIPHYNSVELLKRLLLSISFHNDVQVIIIDDHSSENIEQFNELIKQFPQYLFLSNTTPKNSAGTCRNIGLEHALGKWILFADADDFFLNNWYSHVSIFFSSYYDIIFFPPTSRMESTFNTGTRHILYTSLINSYLNTFSNKSELCLRYLYSSPCSKMISCNMIQKNHIRFEEILISNDVMFSCKCGYYAEKIYCSDDTIYCISQNNTSLTSTPTQEKQLIRMNTKLEQYAFLYLHLSPSEMNLLEYTAFVDEFINDCIARDFTYEQITQLLDRGLKYGVTCTPSNLKTKLKLLLRRYKLK